MLAGLNGTDVLISKDCCKWESSGISGTSVPLMTIRTSTGNRRTRTEGLHCCTNHQDQLLFPVVPNYSGAISLISRPGSYIYWRIRMWLAEVRVCKSSHIKFVPFWWMSFDECPFFFFLKDWNKDCYCSAVRLLKHLFCCLHLKSWIRLVVVFKNLTMMKNTKNQIHLFQLQRTTEKKIQRMGDN